MSDTDDSAEKSFEPSQRKLEESRRKGEIARAPDLLTSAAYLGLLLTLAAVGGLLSDQFGEALLPLLAHPDQLADAVFAETGPFAATLIMRVLQPVAVLLTVPALCVLAVLLATRGITVTPSKLVPKLQRISPIGNAKNKFGRRGLFEFSKSFAKLVIFGVCLGLFLAREIDLLTGLPRAEPGQAVLAMTTLMIRLLVLVTLVAITIGAIDFFWQRADHLRRNRMTLKEMRDEMKDSEGDPMVKQQRRNRAQEIAMNQMMQDVPTADVVIVNPTHYAVALKWSRLPGEAPVCVAKGVDEIALRIRQIALENGVPIHADPPTARAVYATTEIGAQIAFDHYKPVAAAIRFAEAMRVKARKRGW
ncbi:flagellar type III secretion system protein FlhB [Thalassococcus sp. CAU 1522]|uniref:Flagellar type III secretion system protein FlhB n=1 Tax=Thalassococcus arenae TaxID=2851652 RepID=A0ABS6N5R4_9RHOB|nr:flagellar type III secretion system protein FlhB [Thalassococcus arenae]MBV2359341.1 flagellar type III secretion system protein FlhB [Thalassococcus arenae]